MADLFPTVTGLRKGYDVAQVDAFFTQTRADYENGEPAERFSGEKLRAAAFDLVRGGYRADAVDAAMSRLEGAFIQRDRSAYVAEHGEAAWFDRIADEATTLYPRLLRPAGDRFDHPSGRRQGYSAAEVDALLDRLSAFFDDKDTLTEAQLRSVTFRPARGAKAYREEQVDAYLGRAIQVLLAVS